MRLTWLFLPLLLPACVARSQPRYMATIHPIAAIMQEVIGARGRVSEMLPPGASPHTFEPRPSDVESASAAFGLFYVGPALDSWAAGLPAKQKVALLSLVPRADLLPYVADPDEPAGTGKGSEGDFDPHFWMDPLTVKAMLPGLVDTLCKHDSGSCSVYRSNAARLSARLQDLDRQVAEILAPVRGRPVFLFHPSLRYLLKRYGLKYAGVIEPFPGKEPSPRYLQRLVRRLHQDGAKAVFSEPQLPRRPAEVLAETAHVKLRVLDDSGGVAGRMTYAELILYTARVLREALE
jgi:ABC-type Zn uptake system ZnuABC Zn-binding protein ZnuA